MTISSLALGAKKVIDAAWLHGGAYDLSSQAAFALESAQLLQSPETAAEVKRLRAERAEVGNEVARFGIYGAALPATKALVKRANELVTENAQLRARVAELEADVLLLNTQRGDVAQLIERERGEGEECVDIDDLTAALSLGSDETAETGGA